MQILWGFTSDTDSVTWVNSALRNMFMALDQLAASILYYIYQVLFKIADSTIISGTITAQLVEKFQVVLGVYMLFKLSISILQYIVNPDAMNDKQNGIGNIIQRILVTLVLLTAVVPLHIPESAYTEGDYNYYLKEHGLLFGTLYSLQHRILRDDVIGSIILGKNYKASSENNINFSDDDSVAQAGDRVALKLLLIGIHPNNPGICTCDRVVDTNNEGNSDNLKQQCANWAIYYMGATGEALYKKYSSSYSTDNITTDNLMYHAKNSICKKGEGENFIDTIGVYLETKYTHWWGYIPVVGNIGAAYEALTTSTDTYAFSYAPLIGFILCAFVIVALVSACVDIAIRALKLVILRIIAPIPILSYLEPQGEKSSFNAWVKLVAKTYLQLFIRLAVIYFIVFIVSTIVSGGLNLPFDGSLTGLFATGFIIVGLFLFAQKAPQFIYEAIGLKYEGPQLFKGLGQLAGVGSSALGAIGSAKSAYEGAAKRHSDAKLPLGLSKALNVGSALLGGMGGFRAGVRATADEKDGHFFASARGAQGRYNTRAASGSNAFGRMGDSLSEMLTGQTRYDKDQMDLEKLKNFQNLHKRIETKAEADGDYKLRSGGAGVAGRTVKEIAKEFEDLKNSGTATKDQIKKARENLDKAKIEYYRDAINKDSDFYAKNANGNYIYAFADQVGVVRDEMETIATRYGIDMGYGAGNGYVKGGTIDPDVYKRSVFTADNMHHSIEHSGAYTAHKANHDYMNSGKK